ncbi:MAG: hypothetical protein ACQJCO_03940 [cyanobacterium endosymbiont of Rhopalodia sterrenbergii]
MAIVLILIQPWVSSSLALFYLSLLFQIVSIRLQVTPIILDVCC